MYTLPFWLVPFCNMLRACEIYLYVSAFKKNKRDRGYEDWLYLQFILHLCVSDCVVLNSVLLCKTKAQARNVDTRSRTETQNKETEPEIQTRVERMRSKLGCRKHFNTDHKNRPSVEMWLVLSTTLFKDFSEWVPSSPLVDTRFLAS